MKSRAASKPPSRKIAPRSASKASPSAEVRWRPPAGLFAAAEDKKVAQAVAIGYGSQRAAVCQLRPRFRQRALFHIREAEKQFVGQHHAKHRIAKEFETLVLRRVTRPFMSYRGVSKGQAQQTFILKGVPQPFLQLTQICHGLV